MDMACQCRPALSASQQLANIEAHNMPAKPAGRFGPGEYALMGAPYMYGHKGYGQLGDHTGVQSFFRQL
jgi:hypothetical protein